VKVVMEDRKQIFQALAHISDAHLNPKGASSMKVKVAAQMFSNRMASAISTEHRIGKFHFTLVRAGQVHGATNM